MTFMNQASKTELMGNIETNAWVKEYILGFVLWMYNGGIKANSMKVYLAAVRARFMEAGYPDPTKEHLVTQAIKGVAARTVEVTRNATPMGIHSLARQAPSGWSLHIRENFDERVKFAAITMCFTGAFRAGELRTQQRNEVHMRRFQVQFNQQQTGYYAIITLLQHKTGKAMQHRSAVAMTAGNVCVW